MDADSLLLLLLWVMSSSLDQQAFPIHSWPEPALYRTRPADKISNSRAEIDLVKSKVGEGHVGQSRKE